jgi:hypothetical protein
MTEPERYWDAPPGDARRRVVQSAQLDVPSADARAKTIALLGLEGAPPFVPSAPRRLGRWMVVGIAGLALLGGGAVHFSRAPRQVASEATAVERAPSPPAIPILPVAALPVVSAKAAETAVLPAVIAPASPDKRREAEDDLGAQLALIDGARALLAQGNARDTLARLREYDSRYPGGALGPEATALRVEALLRAGERAKGQALGEKFVAQHPNGPYATRIRSLLAQAP